MPKKKFFPSGGAREEKRRFRWLLYQKPKAYVRTEHFYGGRKRAEQILASGDGGG